MKKKLHIHYIQHVPFEGLAGIEDWANNHGHKISSTKTFNLINFPFTKDLKFDWLIIMGGPMSVNDHDKYEWILEEKKFITKAISQNKVVLGVCLGAQFIASVFDEKVFANTQKEIGWYPVNFSFSGEWIDLVPLAKQIPSVMHWHGETFSLPPTASLLASSEITKNQMFSIGSNILGIQFHMELKPENIKDMVENMSHELVSDSYVQESDEILSNTDLCEINCKLMYAILDKLALLNP